MNQGQPSQRAGQAFKSDCLAFLKSLGQSVKVVSLYKISHPASVTAVGEAYKLFEIVLEGTGSDRLTLTLSEERWMVNGAALAPAAQGPQNLKDLFRGLALTSLTFLQGAGLYEFSALFEMFREAPKGDDGAVLRDRLIQRGIRRILADTIVYSSIQKASTPPTPAPPKPVPNQGRAFSSLLKNLIEGAVTDPDERAHVYGEALGMLKEALDRHVQTSTHALKSERERILKEQVRAETVLSTVAAGKVIVDKDGKVLMMNPAAEQITGKRLAELAGKPIDEAVDAKDQMIALSADLQLREGQDLSRDIRVLADQDVESALKRSLAVIHDESGRLVGTYAVLPDAAKLKEAQKIQEDFVSRLTHDLKAPLASICCALELISEKLGPRLGPKETAYMDICLRNSRRLGEMIKEILDFSKLDSGQLSVNAAAIPVEPIFQEAVEGLQPWAQHNGLALCADPPEPGLAVRADHRRVVEILINLISNAIKSTPRGGRITVSARVGQGARRGCAVVAVSDTGCGIASGDCERIFDKFVKLEDGNSRDGVGLGLTIVKELVRLHGGEIWVESQVGRGSTFSFSIPLSDAAETGDLACGIRTAAGAAAEAILQDGRGGKEGSIWRSSGAGAGS